MWTAVEKIKQRGNARTEIRERKPNTILQGLKIQCTCWFQLAEL
jgi:hypothetical protein